MGSGRMTYKGIEFTLKMVELGIWKYRFYIGRAVKIGTTKTDLESVAVQRTQKRIDRELKIAGFPLNFWISFYSPTLATGIASRPR
jgi:hypothetical protein